VDPVKRSVKRGHQNIDLSRSEFNLLFSLLQSAGQCVSRKALMDNIWGTNREVGQGALDVLVNSLRSKIEALHQPRLIHTVRGSGYLLSSASRTAENTQL
jgi:DNA-binding response OmpR family regulator